jgi:hypothetical protein
MLHHPFQEGVLSWVCVISFFVESLIVWNISLMTSPNKNKSGRSSSGSPRMANLPHSREIAANMRKSRILDVKVKGNVANHLSYREAWARIGAARGHGFCLEAVTLVESMITDRLVSYSVGVGALARANELSITLVLSSPVKCRICKR